MRRVLALALILPATSAAAYNVEAVTSKDWPAAAGTLAVVPAACPPDFDCAWFDETVEDYFSETEPPTPHVDSGTVAQALMDTGTDQLTEDNMPQIAEALGVQAFFVVTVGSSEVESSGGFATQVGRSVVVTPSLVGRGSLEVRVLSPDGRLLAKATGYGESGWRTGRRLVGAVFEEVFYRLFPEE